MIEFLRGVPYKTYVGIFLCGLLASYWLVPRLSWFVARLGLLAARMDRDSRHGISGGLALGIPFVVGIALLTLLRNQVSDNMYMVPYQMRGLFFGSIIAMGIGLAHDIIRINSGVRLTFQIALGLFAYYYGFRLLPSSTNYGFEALDISLLALSVFWIVGVINVFELLERTAGKLLHLAILPVGGLLVAAFVFDEYRAIVVCCLLLGGLLGLISQRGRQMIPIIGSTGAHVLGYALAVTTMQAGIFQGWENIVVMILLPIGGVLLLVAKPKLRVFMLPTIAFGGDTKISESFHYKEAARLALGVGETHEALWETLCEAAHRLGFVELRHYTSLGKALNCWSPREGTKRESLHLPLARSGGEIVVCSSATPLTSSLEFLSEIVYEFDYRLERLNLRAVGERTNDMRLLIINRHVGGTSATGQIVQDLAEDLTKYGIAVSALASSVQYEESAAIVGRNEIVDGFHIRRIPATLFGRSSYWLHLVDMAFFYGLSVAWIIGVKRSQYSHIMILTDPPLIALLGFVGKRVKGWRFIYSVHDLYPDIALALGVLRPGLIYRTFKKANIQILKRADLVIPIGRHQAVYLQRYVSSERIETILNWADGRLIGPGLRNVNAPSSELELGGKFTVFYAGNLGPAQNMDVVVELIKSFKGSEAIQFVFVGVGTRRLELAEIVRSACLTNIIIVEYVSRQELSRHLAAGDLGLVSLSPRIEGMALPTKTYSYLAAGLPVLAIAASGPDWEFLPKHGLGAHFSPQQLDPIVSFIFALSRREHYFDIAHIRSYFERHFDRKIQTRKYANALAQLVDQPTEAITRARAAALPRHEN